MLQAFCHELTVTAYAEREDDAEYQTMPLFDAWRVNQVDGAKTKQELRTLVGQNRLLGQAMDYYSFHWLAGSEINAEFKTVKQPESPGVTWVYFLQGKSTWDDMKRHLLADNSTAPPCVHQSGRSSCLGRHVISENVNVSLPANFSVNTTDDYYMVFYTNATGGNGSNTEAKASDVISELMEEANSAEIMNHPHDEVLPAPLGIIWYELNMNLTLYDVTKMAGRVSVGTKQSEISTTHVDAFILLDFNPSYRTTTGSNLKDFSNIIVNMECHARLLTYIAVFGLVSMVLIIITMIITLVIINKKFEEGDFGVNSGDYTRLVT